MNNQLIEKVIKTNSKTCPPMHYNNPLIDRQVASALSKSFVKTLNLSSQRNTNNNLRTLVLSSIRRVCKTEPENHLKVDENFTNLLKNVYTNVIEDNLKTCSSDKSLDELLMRNLKDLSLSSNYEYTINPEIVQSLLNLNDNKLLDSLCKNIMHLQCSKRHDILLQSVWNNSVDSINIDDISIKIKSEIEHRLLDICHEMLVVEELNLENIFEGNASNLCKKCAKSMHCFQICCNILNYMLIETSFNLRILKLITLFISKVKLHCDVTISTLYPFYLSHVVLLMDIQINSLPDCIRINYTQKVLILLKNLNVESPNDFTMLLSHFPDWFDIYFS